MCRHLRYKHGVEKQSRITLKKIAIISKNKSANKEKSLSEGKVGFDAVKTMREIRDQLSKEIMNMTFAEEKAYLKKLLAKKAVKAS